MRVTSETLEAAADRLMAFHRSFPELPARDIRELLSIYAANTIIDWSLQLRGAAEALRHLEGQGAK